MRSNAIVKDLKLLKGLFKNKMEQKARNTLGLIKHSFNDKDVDILIEHFRAPERRSEFFREYKEIEMLYEIISPDAFLRPFMERYGTLTAIFQIVRKAYARRIQADRNCRGKRPVGPEACEFIWRGIARGLVEINADTVELIKKRKAATEPCHQLDQKH